MSADDHLTDDCTACGDALASAGRWEQRAHRLAQTTKRLNELLRLHGMPMPVGLEMDITRAMHDYERAHVHETARALLPKLP